MKCYLKIHDLAESVHYFLAPSVLLLCIRTLLQTGWNSMFSTSTMSRTRIGLKLNHTQMV